MAQSCVSLVVHVVFSTKDRMPFISADHRERLYDYMGGIVRRERGILLEIGGMPDHIHLLACLRASVSLSEMLRLIKGRSSHWMNGLAGSVHLFGSQNGYAWF